MGAASSREKGLEEFKCLLTYRKEAWWDKAREQTKNSGQLLGGIGMKNAQLIKAQLHAQLYTS